MDDDTGRSTALTTCPDPAREGSDAGRVRLANGALARRRFLVGIGAVSVASALQPEWVMAADMLVIPNAEGFLLVDMKKCQGCGTCMMICSLAHSGEASYSLSRIQIQQDSFASWPDDIRIAQCHQCPQAPCVEVCPVRPVRANKPNADFGNVRMIDQDLCVGCQKCIKACPFTPARLQFKSKVWRTQKCDLCVDTPHLGAKGGPGGVQACVQACPVGAIAFTRDMPKTNTEESYRVDLRGPVWKKLGMTTD